MITTDKEQHFSSNSVTNTHLTNMANKSPKNIHKYLKPSKNMHYNTQKPL